MDGKSLDIVQDNIEKLKQLFPNIFSEGKIDFARLKQELGEDVLTKSEHYELSWAGKNEARLEIQKRTTATLVPDKEGSIDFDTAQNIFIEGENLETLRVLQQSYFGRVKMIYIDPPYNTGNDSFVYPDDYSERREDYQKRTNITDEDGYLNKQDLWRKNSKENGQYHSAWLSMMYPRLYIARNLLREDGVIFISIDDNEQANLKLLCDEVFGEENFITDITWEKRFGRSNDAKLMASIKEHILFYRKSESVSYLREPRTEETNASYSNPDGDERGDWTSISYLSQRTKEQRPNLSYKVKNPFTQEEVEHPVNAWKFSYETYLKHADENRLFWGKNGTQTYPRLKRFLSELSDGLVPVNLWKGELSGTVDEASREVDKILGKEIFDYPKPSRLIKRMLELITNSEKDALILDFFAGSGSTAQAVMELNEEDGGNRRFICVQMPELLDEKSEAYKTGKYRTIADICKERIHRSIAKIEKEREGKLEFETKQKLAFAAYKLKPSNFKIWQSDADKMDLAQQLIDFTQSERAESLPQNMLIELLLKNEKEALTINYSFEDGFYKTQKTWFCFEAYVKQQKELLTAGKPQEVIYLNSCFTSDEDLTNLKLELQENNIKLTLV